MGKEEFFFFFFVVFNVFCLFLVVVCWCVSFWFCFFLVFFIFLQGELVILAGFLLVFRG